MKKLSTRLIGTFALAVGFGLLGNANASSTWTFNANSITGSTAATHVSGTPVTADPTLSSISGVYAANGANAVGFASGATWQTSTTSTTHSTNPSCPSGQTCTGAALQYYSGYGLGMDSDGDAAPNHAMDNVGNTEAVLLNFASSVVLSSVGVGYVNGDADLSLFRYTGTAAPAMTGVGASLASMISAGWELVSNTSNLSVDTTAPYTAVNSNNLGSSWWMITAYNSSYGGSGMTEGDDYFKLYAVAGSKCTSTVAGVCAGVSNRVPEPGSLALIGIGLVGALGVRRRKLSVTPV